MHYIHLSVAILAELVATLSLKESAGFNRLVPSVLVLIGYGAAFYFMSLAMKNIPVGVVYAIWSAGGLVLITAFSAWRFAEQPDLPALMGMLLIVLGVFCLTGWSKMSVH